MNVCSTKQPETTARNSSNHFEIKRFIENETENERSERKIKVCVEHRSRSSINCKVCLYAKKKKNS